MYRIDAFFPPTREWFVVLHALAGDRGVLPADAEVVRPAMC
ncbi:hypothetical protein AB0E08_13145 [Streptomyces sp. NPDC048281]